MRRAFWALVGVGLGAVVGVQSVRWVNKQKKRYSPPNLAREAGAKAGDLRERFAGAVEEGLKAMVEREAEIREELGLPPSWH